MITVFTPTHNRETLLRRCYESLEKQTDKNFQWLVIDDGSSDHTKEIVEELKTIASFVVSYYYQDNGGKHRAFNKAVKECNTEYFLVLDSDDALTNDAIEKLNKKCQLIENDNAISGIIGNQGYFKKKCINGVRIPKVGLTTGLELYQKLNFRGDTLRLYKTSVLKKYPFPEIPNETFVPENVVFDAIDTKYKMLAIQDILYLSEYQKNGLSKNINSVRINNPIGYSLSLKSTAETALSLKKRIGVTILYIMWTRRFMIKDSFRKFRRKTCYIMCWPISFLFQLFRIPRFYYDTFKEQK